jgi:large subunit ribosomal protein L18
MAELKAVRLTVHRSNSHIYAQIIDASGGRVLTSASTLESELRGQLKHGGNVAAAAAVGKRIAEKAKGLGIERVAFDRAGFRYHGRVKALADAAREGGLKF